MNKASAGLKSGQLTVDACVIDDQPEHIVLAVRVPKDTIAANIPLMAYLADQSGPIRLGAAYTSDFPAGAVSVPPRRKTARRAALVGLAGFVGLSALVLTQPMGAVTRPPITWLDFRVETPVVAPGGHIELTVVGHRTRLCKTDIDRAIVAPDGDVTVWRQRAEGLSQAVTREPITRKIRIPLPDGLPDGKYIYRSTTFSECGGDESYSLQSPDLAFEVRS
jgi:hypothetical protein